MHEQDFNRKVYRLIREQDSPSLDPALKLTPNADPNQIFYYFARSRPFAKLAKEVIGQPFRDNLHQNPKLAFMTYNGRLFQDLTSWYLPYILQDELQLLSPESTCELYQSFYPKRPIRKNDMGLDSIAGTWVPDGVLVDPSDNHPSVLSLYEYTLSQQPTYFLRKYTYFLRNLEEFGHLLGDASCIFLITKPEKDNDIHNQIGPLMDYEQMPFTYTEFIGFASRARKFLLSKTNSTFFGLSKLDVLTYTHNSSKKGGSQLIAAAAG